MFLPALTFKTKKGLNDPMRAQRHTVSPPDQEKLMNESPPSETSKNQLRRIITVLTMQKDGIE